MTKHFCLIWADFGCIANIYIYICFQFTITVFYLQSYSYILNLENQQNIDLLNNCKLTQQLSMKASFQRLYVISSMECRKSFKNDPPSHPHTPTREILLLLVDSFDYLVLLTKILKLFSNPIIFNFFYLCFVFCFFCFCLFILVYDFDVPMKHIQIRLCLDLACCNLIATTRMPTSYLSFL